MRMNIVERMRMRLGSKPLTRMTGSNSKQKMPMENIEIQIHRVRTSVKKCNEMLVEGEKEIYGEQKRDRFVREKFWRKLTKRRAKCMMKIDLEVMKDAARKWDTQLNNIKSYIKLWFYVSSFKRKQLDGVTMSGKKNEMWGCKKLLLVVRLERWFNMTWSWSHRILLLLYSSSCFYRHQVFQT